MHPLQRPPCRRTAPTSLTGQDGAASRTAHALRHPSQCRAADARQLEAAGVDAGSMETDAQQGIAHYLEHMAFNGTKHATSPTA